MPNFCNILYGCFTTKNKIKNRLHKELKNKKQKQEAFRKKMKELEIK